jgi:hypothetical protein
VRDSRLVRSDIALPIDDSLDPAPSIKRHGIRDTGDKNFAGRAALAGEDGVLRDKPLPRAGVDRQDCASRWLACHAKQNSGPWFRCDNAMELGRMFRRAFSRWRRAKQPSPPEWLVRTGGVRGTIWQAV